MKNDLLNDVSILSTIPKKYLIKLTQKEILCINDYIAEATIANENSVDIDIGIGDLLISWDEKNNRLQYYFTPSDELNENVRATIANKQNILESTLEDNLASKIVNTYKDFL